MTMADKTGGRRKPARLELLKHPLLNEKKTCSARLVVKGRAPIAAGSDPLHGEYVVNNAIVY
jgi:hypothetical protein